MTDEIKTPEPTKLSWLDYAKILLHGRGALETAINEGKIVADRARTAGVKSLGFWLTLASAVGAIGSQVGGFIPPPWGAVVLAGSSLFYAVSRGFVKRDDPLGGAKPTLATSEAWVNILASVGQVAMASSGAVDPKISAILLAVHAAAVGASESLSATGAQPSDPGTKPE